MRRLLQWLCGKMGHNMEPTKYRTNYHPDGTVFPYLSPVAFCCRTCREWSDPKDERAWHEEVAAAKREGRIVPRLFDQGKHARRGQLTNHLVIYTKRKEAP